MEDELTTLVVESTKSEITSWTDCHTQLLKITTTKISKSEGDGSNSSGTAERASGSGADEAQWPCMELAGRAGSTTASTRVVWFWEGTLHQSKSLKDVALRCGGGEIGGEICSNP